MSTDKPTPTPLARVLDEHWREIVEVGGTPIWRAPNAETVALWRREIRRRARSEGVLIRTHAVKTRDGGYVGTAWVPDISEAQLEAAQERRHNHGRMLPER
jgi:hypothetical protein